jgi:hypothetical protein
MSASMRDERVRGGWESMESGIRDELKAAIPHPWDRVTH